MVMGWSLHWQETYTKAVYTGLLEGEAWYVNMQETVQHVGVHTGGANFFQFVIKTEKSRKAKSDVFNMSSKLTNHKHLMAK